MTSPTTAPPTGLVSNASGREEVAATARRRSPARSVRGGDRPRRTLAIMTARSQGTTRRISRLGWARSTALVEDEGPILDLGSGAFPNAAADILCDGFLEDARHRHGLAAVVDRPTVVARAEALPFRDGAFAFLIASHIAEHVEDPGAFCRELRRVAGAGYIETPSPLLDRLCEEEYHLWRVDADRGRLCFFAKSAEDRRPRPATDAFYRVYNAGQACSRPTLALPPGPLGRVLGLALLVVRAGLGRSGLIYTRYLFGPSHPLRWKVLDGAARPSRHPAGATGPAAPQQPGPG